MSDQEIEYVDNANAPILYADDLHDVSVIGQNCFFTLVEFRKTPNGILYKEPAFHFRFPCIKLAPAIALTLRNTGTTLVPAVKVVVRELTRGWLH